MNDTNDARPQGARSRTALSDGDRPRVLSVLVENQHGVLTRVSGMLAARGFNIDSLTVSVTEDITMSRMTVAFHCDGRTIEKVRKQLAKITEVIVIEDVTERPHVERELVLVKVRHPRSERHDLLQIAAIFKAKSVDMTPESVTFEIVGNADKLFNFLTLLQEHASIVELARSGVVALSRGPVALREGFLQEGAGS